VQKHIDLLSCLRCTPVLYSIDPLSLSLSIYLSIIIIIIIITCISAVGCIQQEAHDAFVEYPMGYVKYAYSGDCVEARTHQSGWAARNANNHNQVVGLST